MTALARWTIAHTVATRWRELWAEKGGVSSQSMLLPLHGTWLSGWDQPWEEEGQGMQDLVRARQDLKARHHRLQQQEQPLR